MHNIGIGNLTRQGGILGDKKHGIQHNISSVLVAGDMGGLGRAVSSLEEGAHVVVTYRKQEELDALKNLAVDNSSQLDDVGIDATLQVGMQSSTVAQDKNEDFGCSVKSNCSSSGPDTKP